MLKSNSPNKNSSSVKVGASSSDKNIKAAAARLITRSRQSTNNNHSYNGTFGEADAMMSAESVVGAGAQAGMGERARSRNNGPSNSG